jgi:hypothetical protein
VCSSRHHLRGALGVTVPDHLGEVLPPLPPALVGSPGYDGTRPGLLVVCITAPYCGAVSECDLRSLGRRFSGPTVARAGAADQDNLRSTVGSSPGVAEKRILGVFSLRTSDEDYKQFRCVCEPPQMVGIWIIRLSPSSGSMNHQTRTCGAGAIRLPASLCTATRCGLRHDACRPAEAILGPLAGCLCSFLHLSFGEFTFHDVE